MAQVKLTLRPPPNVDFVTGYPGIPPAAPDRPQAAVKGAVEVRVGAQGVKALWVRIELRKVESLPGGGLANTFYDFVGPSPVNLWQESEQSPLLKTQDFPFVIRIPESIPPTIALENRAGIQYELVASVCTKVKKGWFRKRKSVVVSTQSGIIIDKHELHTTWPVYCQPDKRFNVLDGVTLTAERSNTCYGPGDRIAVIATLKSDSLSTVKLLGFEIALVETTIFRAGPFSALGKKGGPQSREQVISENKLVMNATIYGGMQQRAELVCGLSPNHTNTTLNAARHIDITYALFVRAVMAVGPPITVELPVIISNWQRIVSQEAVRRIGPAPSLSLLPIGSAAAAAATPQTLNHALSAQSINGLAANNVNAVQAAYSDRGYGSTPVSGLYGGAGGAGGGGGGGTTVGASSSTTKIDEFGYTGSGGYKMLNKSPETRTSEISSEDVPLTSSASVTTATGNGNGNGRRPGSAKSANGGRFTVTNALGSEMPTAGGSGGAGGSAVKQYPTAAEEKRMYEAARSKVEQVQGAVARAIPPPQDVMSPQPYSATSASRQQQASTSPRTANNGPWPTAEQEKAAFRQAQEAAQRNQGLDSYIPSPASLHSRSNSDLNNARIRAGSSGSGATQQQPPTSSASSSSAAAMYSQAMAAAGRNRAAAEQYSYGGGGGGGASSSAPSQAAKIPQYLTAEQEKAALRRYEEAKSAVDRTHGLAPADDYAHHPPTSSQQMQYQQQQQQPQYQYATSGGGASSSSSSAGVGGASSSSAAATPLTAYDSLYPGSQAVARNSSAASSFPGNGSINSQQRTDMMPPPPHSFDGANLSSVISEKERLRRTYEAQDAAAAAAQRQQQQQRDNVNALPPPFSAGSTALPPPFSSHDTSSSSGSRSASPPSFGAATSSSGQPLSALEEKELLRRKFAAQDGNASSSSAAAPSYGMGMATTRAASPPQPPPARNSRPTPLLPTATGQQILTAAEEKALLKARYEAEARGGSGLSPLPSQQSGTPSRTATFAAGGGGGGGGSSVGVTRAATTGNGLNGSYNGNAGGGGGGGSSARYPTSSSSGSGSGSSSAAAAPPPLMPRPPKEYIKETQAEDARVSKFVHEAVVPVEALDDVPVIPTTSRSKSLVGMNGGSGSGSGSGSPYTPVSSSSASSAFSPGYNEATYAGGGGGGGLLNGRTPPLPPKPVGE